MFDSYFLFVLASGLAIGFLFLILVAPIVYKFDAELLFLVPVFFAAVLMFVMVFYSDPFTPDCPACGASYFEEPYCSSCGADLIDDCVCGHVWTDKDIYCPECGVWRYLDD